MSKSSALLDEERKVSLVISTNTDITQQKKEEQELKRFKHMADNATEPFILMRQDATFAYLNDVALERWGYSREEAKLLRVPDVDPVYNDEVFSKAFAMAQQEKIPQFESLHRKKDSTIYPVEVNMSGLLLDGTPHLFAITIDITERKKLEEAQKESQEKIRSFIVQAPVAMCLYRGQDYIIEIVNKELLAIWDKPYEAVIGKPVFEVLPEAKNQGFDNLLQKVFTTGEKFTAFGIPLMLKKDGKLQKIYVNLVYEAYRETDGSISGIVEVVTNVTEQVEAGQKIKESEERFGAAVQAVQGIVWTNNAKGEMDGEQPAWADLTGQSYEEYKGFGWAKAVHPDDAQPTIDAWNIAVNERKIFVFEHRVKMSHGQWGHFSVRAIPLLNTDGSIRQWVGVHTNITQKRIAEEALKESEEKFRGLAETLPHLVWITNEKGEAVYASNSWQEYSGFNPYEVGNWPAIVHPDDMEAMTNAWLGSLESGNLYHAEARLKNKSGEYRWHVVEGVPLRHEEGKISKWIGAFTDINEQKLKEQKKDEFISIASHEMKTPLTTAKGYLELLLLTIGEENPTPLLYAQKASNSIERLHDLVAELLDASKIQNGKLNYNISTFDFNEMLNETIENIQQGSSSHIITKHGKSLHNIKGDKNRLQQVIINLLTNAIKYSPNANSVLVEVVEKENVLQVSVKDYGIGMYKEHLDKIFDRYYRVQEHALHFQGLGIGLYISYDIIRRHEGTMWAESEPGIGSTFYFTIPIQIA